LNSSLALIENNLKAIRESISDIVLSKSLKFFTTSSLSFSVGASFGLTMHVS